MLSFLVECDPIAIELSSDSREKKDGLVPSQVSGAGVTHASRSTIIEHDLAAGLLRRRQRLFQSDVDVWGKGAKSSTCHKVFYMS